MIKTRELTIRRFKESDWEDLFEYLSQENVVKFEPYNVYTKEQCKQEAYNRTIDERFFAVCLTDTDKLIGNIYLSHQGLDTWEIGYVFNEKYQHRGYATQSITEIIDYLFNEKNAHRIVAMCNPQNTPSWRLLERLKFRREGCLIKNVYFNKDANERPIWQDTYEYALLNYEWKINNRSLK